MDSVLREVATRTSPLTQFQILDMICRRKFVVAFNHISPPLPILPPPDRTRSLTVNKFSFPRVMKKIKSIFSDKIYFVFLGEFGLNSDCFQLW
ncbi:hypothetical protein CEXT_777881 [Caerostris extrusa]|uniref:Uncharacterized protein n=1 Tax=Caerostris extrusa TaxID=172846 RepID=A0AAV4R2N8_CAEEX|nr:hypothetical protein CEXT_777881 [Caerostris extrusa]